jgi:hypothetical protein
LRAQWSDWATFAERVDKWLDRSTLRREEGDTFIRPVSAGYMYRKEVEHYELPKLTSDKEAEEFVASSALTEYHPSGMRAVRFEFQPNSMLAPHTHPDEQGKIK